MRRYPPLEFDIDKCSLFPPACGLDECGTPPRADPWPRPRPGDLSLFRVWELPRPRLGDGEPERDRPRPGACDRPRPGECDRPRLERLGGCVRYLAGASATTGADIDDADDADDGEVEADDDEDGVGVGTGAGAGAAAPVTAPVTDGCESNS